jgi:RimJ/RimL family protein N-acetyltransferase
VIGEVILKWASREHRQGEIGYAFHPRCAGKGYATEAAGVMLRLGFDDLGLRRIIGRLDVRNTASRASWNDSACAVRRISCRTRS